MIRKSNLPQKSGVLFGVVLALASVVRLPAQNAEDLRLISGKSVIMDYPSDVGTVNTSNPDVVDVTLRTTREILLSPKGTGSATLIVWNRANQRTLYNINVEMNLESLRELYKDSFPNEKIQVHSSRDTITLNGMVSTKDVADKAGALAAAVSKTVLNNLTLAPAPVEKQVLLRVKFALLDREKEVQFGVNLLAGPGGNPIGTTTGQFANGNFTGTMTIPSTAAGSTSTNTGGSTVGAGTSSTGGTSTSATGNNGTFSITNALNLFALDPKLNLGAFIKALQQESVLQILAEPTLVTTNGKEATFLSGGEFPVPIVQGGATSGAITIQFRRYGIGLNFLPQITANNTIAMHIKQEVSTLDYANAVSLNGFTIPALATRTAESSVELGDGQSFVVAGLVNNQEVTALAKVPILGDLPILGNLFKSKDNKIQRTDLIMVVTPEITMPIGANDAVPNLYMPKEFLKKLELKDVQPLPKAQASGRPSKK